MTENSLKYRLGLDLGTNSIGWCMLRLNNNNEPVAVMKSGVRIFHDGRNEKTKEPLAVVRRNARSIRRNLDRKISRRNHLLNTLIKYGLLPLDENGEEPDEGEVYIYRYFEDEEGNPSLENIEDEDEAEMIEDIFEQWLDDQEFEEM